MRENEVLENGMREKDARKWAMLSAVLFLLLALCIALPQRAKADEVEMENICILRPGETYGLWTRQYDAREWKLDTNRYELVSSNRKVVRVSGFGKNEYGQVVANITGRKKGTAKVRLRNKYTHQTVATCKVIVAKYTRYSGGPRLTGSYNGFHPYYSKAKISGSQLTIAGNLTVQKNHRTYQIKRVKTKRFRLTSRTLYGGYEEGTFYTSTKKNAKANLNHLTLGCEIYVANGKVLLIGFIS